MFSYLGMVSQEIQVKGNAITLFMEEDVNLLDEVKVSVGYFDLSKKDLSGSVSQIKNKQITTNRTQSVENLIQGQVAGVVVSESGEPGGGIGISIRGTNSLLGGTQPLYVVDGIPIDPISDAQGNNNAGQTQNSAGFLNPNDIQKIEILKDAAATAIYGARGANGVVVIATKTADSSKGKDQISVNAEHFVSVINKKIDVLDGPTFEKYLNQRHLNQLFLDITNPDRNGGPFDGSLPLNNNNYPELDELSIPYPVSTGIDTDWQNKTYRMANSNAYNIGYRGHMEKMYH